MSKLSDFFHIAVAFIVKDFKVATSYKLNFILSLFSVLFSSTFYFMLSKLIGSADLPALRPYNTQYFPFLIIGIAFNDYFNISTNFFASEIRKSQITGTLEALLVTPTSYTTILLSSYIYQFLYSSIRILIYLFMATVVFNVKFSPINLPAFFITFTLLLISFIGIGLFSAAFIIIFKQGSPVGYILGISASLLGGVYYPVTILPDWLSPFSVILPITHGLEALRAIFLNNADIHQILLQLQILTGTSVIFVATGLYAITFSIKLAKKEGSLLQY